MRLASRLTSRRSCLLVQAEWLAAQRDEQGMADLEDDEEDGVSCSELAVAPLTRRSRSALVKCH